MVKGEPSILKTLSHPQILRMVDFIESKKRLFMLVDYMQGGDLSRHIKTRRKSGAGYFRENEIAVVMRQLLRALEYLHRQKIVHRDIKPGNILLERPGQLDSLKIADFGLSFRYNKKEPQMKKCGTLNYMAPEIIKGHHEITFKVDTWSAGIVMAILLNGGRHPFVNKGEPEQDVKRKIVKRQLGLESIKCSTQAGDLMRRLLSPMSHRISASEALRHPFITEKSYRLKGEALNGYFKTEKKINRIFQILIFINYVFREKKPSSFRKKLKELKNNKLSSQSKLNFEGSGLLKHQQTLTTTHTSQSIIGRLGGSYERGSPKNDKKMKNNLIIENSTEVSYKNIQNLNENSYQYSFKDSNIPLKSTTQQEFYQKPLKQQQLGRKKAIKRTENGFQNLKDEIDITQGKDSYNNHSEKFGKILWKDPNEENSFQGGKKIINGVESQISNSNAISIMNNSFNQSKGTVKLSRNGKRPRKMVRTGNNWRRRGNHRKQRSRTKGDQQAQPNFDSKMNKTTYNFRKSGTSQVNGRKLGRESYYPTKKGRKMTNFDSYQYKKQPKYCYAAEVIEHSDPNSEIVEDSRSRRGSNLQARRQEASNPSTIQNLNGSRLIKKKSSLSNNYRSEKRSIYDKAMNNNYRLSQSSHHYSRPKKRKNREMIVGGNINNGNIGNTKGRISEQAAASIGSGGGFYLPGGVSIQSQQYQQVQMRNTSNLRKPLKNYRQYPSSSKNQRRLRGRDSKQGVLIGNEQRYNYPFVKEKAKKKNYIAMNQSEASNDPEKGSFKGEWMPYQERNTSTKFGGEKVQSSSKINERSYKFQNNRVKPRQNTSKNNPIFRVGVGSSFHPKSCEPWSRLNR